MIPNEILVEVSIRIRCTIRRNEKVCSCKHRSPLLHQLDLHRPLAEPGRNCCRIFLRICTVNRPAVFTCFSCSGILLSGRLFCQQLFRHPAYQAAKSLYGYLSYNQEVRTAAILRRAQQDGKRVAVPKVFGDEMKFLWLDDLSAVAPGAYNIPEPVADGPEADDETALVLMPGLAFDPEGHRCGYGGGFYDKYLAAHPKHVTLALCYGFQMFSHLDTDAFDIPVQYVISAPVEEEKV